MTTNEQTVQAIIDLTEANGVPPTMRELGKALGLSSPSSVHARVLACVAAGLIDQVGDRKWIIVKEAAK